MTDKEPLKGPQENHSRTQERTEGFSAPMQVNKGLRRAIIKQTVEDIALIIESSGRRANKQMIKMLVKNCAGIKIAPWEDEALKKRFIKTRPVQPRHPLQDRADKERAEYWRKRNEFNSKIERKLA